MTRAKSGRTGVGRLLRTLLVVAAVVVVCLPILVGLVLAWQVHPLVVLPAYLLGIPVWLTLLSGAWALVRRLLPGAGADLADDSADDSAQDSSQGSAQGRGSEPGDEKPAAPPPVITTELRLAAPRHEAPAPRSREASRLRTPTP